MLLGMSLVLGHWVMVSIVMNGSLLACDDACVQAISSFGKEEMGNKIPVVAL
jgi:hypothetical protein